MRNSRTGHTRIAILGILYLWVQASSCKEKSLSERFGVDYNDTRRSLGLRILPDDWRTDRDDGVVLDWVNPLHSGLAKARQPCFAFKTDHFKHGRITEEMNFYYSGKSFLSMSGPAYETVIVYRHFAVPAQGDQASPDWSFDYLGPEKEALKDSTMKSAYRYVPIHVETADSMLTSWGFTVPPR
jgi:hypothetical protein